MIRRLWKDSAVYGLSSVLVQGTGILLLPFYSRVLSPESYGVLEILTVAALFVNMLVPLEIQQGLARHNADAGTDDTRRLLASTTLWFTLAAYAIFLVLSLAASGPIARFLLGSASWGRVLSIAAVSMAFNGVFLVLTNQLRWSLRPVPFALAGVLHAATSAGVAVFLLLVVDAGVGGIFAGQIAGAAAGGITAWRAGRSFFGRTFSPALCRRMLAFSAPLVPSSLSVVCAVFLDRFFIQAYWGLTAVGIYGAGYRIASAVNLLVVGFYSALTPLVYRHYRNEETPRDLERIFRLFLGGALPLVMAISLFSPEIVRLATPPAYFAAWAVVPILSFASVTMRLYMFAPGLDIARKTGIIAGINVAGAALNLAMNGLLVPVWGIEGAAAGTWMSGIAVFAAYLFFSQKLYPVPHRWPRLASGGGAALAVVACGWFFFGPAVRWEACPLLAKSALLVFGTGLLLFALRRPGRPGKGRPENAPAAGPENPETAGRGEER